jgi:hypothetical protein
VRNDAPIGPESVRKSYEEDLENGMVLTPIPPWVTIRLKEEDKPGGVIGNKVPLTMLQKWLGPSQLPTADAVHPVKGNLFDRDQEGRIPGRGDQDAVTVREVPKTATRPARKMTIAKDKPAWEARARQDVQQYGDDLVARQTIASKFHKPDEISPAESGVQPAEQIRKPPSITVRPPKP